MVEELLAAAGVLPREHPYSSLPEVEKVRRKARDTVSSHDYKVGVFYYHLRWYPGAVDRFKKLLDSDPEYSGRDAIYYFLGEIYLIYQAAMRKR